MEKLMTKIQRVKKLAEGGRYICKDEMGKNNFELIIRELGNFQNWQAENSKEPKTGE
tara:strand:- start:213 stop:383 length:171 start_codon:yes stop_codon:yes gene_type:complete